MSVINPIVQATLSLTKIYKVADITLILFLFLVSLDYLSFDEHGLKRHM